MPTSNKKDAEQEVCNICLDKFTEKIRKPVQCKSCNQSTCEPCCRKFILTKIDEPQCANCSVPYNEEHLREQIGSNFWKGEYIKARGDMLLSVEKSMIPASMKEVQQHKEKKSIQQHITQIKHELNMIQDELRLKKRQLYREERRLWLHDSNTKQEPKVMNNRLPCGSNFCKGFCDDFDHVCSVCDQKTCTKCWKISEKNHECKIDDINTAKEIQKNSKPCPNCNVSVFKLEGCDQMYCVLCRTAYSWRTGVVDTGRIHNPHAYLQNNGSMQRELQDEICGGLPSIYTVTSRLCYQSKLLFVKSIHRFLVHLRAVTYTKFEGMRLDFGTNLSDRVQYIVGDIDESKFKEIIVRRDKQIKRLRELCDLYQTFVTCGEEFFRNFLRTTNSSSGTDGTEGATGDRLASNLREMVKYLIIHHGKINRKYGSTEQFATFIKPYHDSHMNEIITSIESFTPATTGTNLFV